MVQYWSAPLGSSSFLQQGGSQDTVRRFPHLHLQGQFNKWGIDPGTPDRLEMVNDSTWGIHYMDEWPATFQLNVWGRNPDMQPDQGWAFGDMINNRVANHLPPHRALENVFNVTEVPPMPALSYRLVVNDATYKVEMHPQGNMYSQILVLLYWLFCPRL